MLGLNHAFAAELLWREYPTDLRGSYFRQFWDPSEYLNLTPPNNAPTAEDLAAQEEAHRDIQPLDEWNGNTLGDNSVTAPKQFLLAVRAELLQRFPNTVVCAQAASVAGTKLQPDPDADYVYPLKRQTIGQDLVVYTFPFTVAKARGVDPNTPNGMFFLFMERPGEPQFGLDETGPNVNSATLASWDDLSWDYMHVNPGANLQIQPGTTGRPRVDDNSDDQVHYISTSADLAYALFQQPVMVAVHANELIRP
jgi:hypothetical protein